MAILEGKTYYGPHNQQRYVTSVTDDWISYRFPTSGTTGRDTPADFAQWMLGSSRRSYLGADGRRLVRLRMYDSDLTMEQFEAGDEPTAMVEVMDVEHPFAPMAMTRDQWNAWRSSAV